MLNMFSMEYMASKTDLNNCQKLLKVLQSNKDCDRVDLIIKSGLSASTFDKLKAIFLRIYEHEVDYNPDTKRYRLIETVKSD